MYNGGSRKYSNMRTLGEEYIFVVRGIIANKAGELLLARRSIENSYDVGLWEFPGGKTNDKPKLSPIEVLEEEIREESGIEASVGHTALYCHTDRFKDNGSRKGRVTSFSAGIALSGLAVPDGKEVSEVAWLPPEQVANLELTPATRAALEIYTAGRSEIAA